MKFCDVPKTGVTVQPGVINDGVGKFVKDIINTSPESDNFEESLRKSLGFQSAPLATLEKCLITHPPHQ